MQIIQGFLDGFIDGPLCNSDSCFSTVLHRWLTRAAECTWRICKVSHAYHKEGHVKGTLWSPVASELVILHSLWGRPHRRMAGTAEQTRNIRECWEASVKLWKGRRQFKMTFSDDGWFSGWTPPYLVHFFKFGLGSEALQQYHWSFFHAFII